MRICFIADGRAPIPRAWITHLVRSGHEVHLISSYPVAPGHLPVASLRVLPLAFSGLLEGGDGTTGRTGGWLRLARATVARLRSLGFADAAMAVRLWLGPVEIRRHVNSARRYLDAIRPDLVHAMRIPFEGMFAALAVDGQPLLISVWGNDFTLGADRHPPTGAMTRRAMRRADGLHCDCTRDIRLARRWGFPADRPAVVLPGSGGVDLTVFRPGPGLRPAALQDLPPRARIVINARGIRSYVRNDVLFAAIPLVRRIHPDALLMCTAMQGAPQAERWLRAAGPDGVRLTPKVSQEELAAYLRSAEVFVSPSVHDGTPNSLLEAMASGCFPVVGDLESIREWISDGVNGLLCDPTDPADVARAIIRALNEADLRRRAAAHNVALIAERAEQGRVMARAEQFYAEVLADVSRRSAPQAGRTPAG